MKDIVSDQGVPVTVAIKMDIADISVKLLLFMLMEKLNKEKGKGGGIMDLQAHLLIKQQLTQKAQDGRKLSGK